MVVVIIGDNHYMLLYTLSAHMQPVYFHKTTLVLETFLPMDKKRIFLEMCLIERYDNKH